MRAIKKDASVPASLLGKKCRETFESSKEARSFPSNNSDYKSAEVYEALRILYDDKCAYCEDTLLNSPKHIEHYRPKSSNPDSKRCSSTTSYFWLAFNWDNLLLACGSCNSAKGSCFDIEGNRADYESQYADCPIDQMQGIIKELDASEKPLLVNPEQEEQSFFDEKLIFTTAGRLLSNDKRLEYTIRICGLNRDGLILLRLELINDLRNAIRLRKARYSLGHGNIEAYRKDIGDLYRDWRNKLKRNPKFSALYTFFDRNFIELVRTTTD